MNDGGRPEELAEARALVRLCGGELATQRVVERTTRAAKRALLGIDDATGARAALDDLLSGLATRST